MINKVFKIGILILGVLFLILYHSNSQVNRYQFLEGKGSGIQLIFDTKTSNFYVNIKSLSDTYLIDSKWLAIKRKPTMILKKDA